jgi:hypothetical protein
VNGCRECGSHAITLHYAKRGTTASQLHQLHEVSVDVFAGCDECSATLWLMSLDQFLGRISAER